MKDNHQTEAALAAKSMLAWCGGVLILYPFCLVANAMSLAAPTNTGGASGPTAGGDLFRVFLWMNTLYPFAYGVSAIISLILLRMRRDSVAMWLAAIPVLYLFVNLVMLAVALSSD